MIRRNPIGHTILCAAMACAGALTLASNAAAQTSDATSAAATPVTLFNILPVKPQAIDAFLPVMQANARASRQEPGNRVFDVFLPEGDGSTVYLYERWNDQQALDAHMQQPHLKAVLDRIGTDLAAEPTGLRLVELPPLGADQRPPFDNASGSRNVIVRLSVKPEQEALFLAALAEVTPHARNAPGNHAFELYRIEDQPQEYVLFERWDSAASHEAHLGQDYSKRLDSVLPGTLAKPVTQDNRYLVRDVAAR